MHERFWWGDLREKEREKQRGTCSLIWEDNIKIDLNPLTPNDPSSGRTAPLTSKRCILFIYSRNIGTAYF